MSESLTRQWRVTKQPIRGKGVVVAQNCRAAEVGAEILRKGGNAIDAAVATGMAIGTVEPWMSGIGGVGFMTIWSAKEGRAWTIDYGPLSARKLDPKNYSILRPGPANPFAWADIHGHLPARRRSRSHQRLAGHDALSQARPSRRDLPAAERRRPARILRRRPGARHRRRSASRRLGHRL